MAKDLMRLPTAGCGGSGFRNIGRNRFSCYLCAIDLCIECVCASLRRSEDDLLASLTVPRPLTDDQKESIKVQRSLMRLKEMTPKERAKAEARLAPVARAALEEAKKGFRGRIVVPPPKDEVESKEEAGSGLGKEIGGELPGLPGAVC